MKTILISGGSGLLGMRLSELLVLRGYKVTHLSRNAKKDSKYPTYLWNIATQEIDPKAIETANFIVHLAGEGIIDKKWTTQRKKEIMESRVNSAGLLHKAVIAVKSKPMAFISASAVGYYGFTSKEEECTEENEASLDFTGQTCLAWENAVLPFEKLMRTVRIRIGIVLSADGGALPKLALPIQFYVGSPLGSGTQPVPWIHIDDVCGIFIKAIEDIAMQGAYNAVGPKFATQKELTQAIAQVVQRPLLLPNVPSFILKFLLGERSALVLEGRRISSAKIEASGYTFQFPALITALKDCFKKNSVKS